MASVPWVPDTSSGDKKKGGFLSRAVSDVYGLKDAPGAIYHAAFEAPALDTIEGFKRLRHPGRHYDTRTHTGQAAIAMAKAQLQAMDPRNASEHPVNFLLAWLPAGEGVARAAEAGTALRAGASAGEAGKVLVNRGPKTPRTLTHEGISVEMPASRSALGRAGQRGYGKAVEWIPDVKTRRIRKQLEKTRRVRERAERGPGAALAGLGRQLDENKWAALRVQSEGVKTAERIRYHQRKIAENQGHPLVVRRHQNEIKALEGARQYLDETGAKPKIIDPHLRDVYIKTKALAGTREKILEPIAPLPPETIKGRISAPGREIKHGLENVVQAPSGQAVVRTPGSESYYPLQRDIEQSHTILRGEQKKLATLERKLARPTANGRPARARPKLQARVDKQRASVREWQAEIAKSQKAMQEKGPKIEEAFSGGEFRVPYTPKVPPRENFRIPTRTGTPPGVPRVPGSLKNPYRAGLLRSANFRPNVPEAVAESYMEAQKLAGLLRDREALKPAIQSAPTTRYHIPIRRDELGGRALSVEDRTLLERLNSGEAMSDTEAQQAMGAYEKLRSRIFPDKAKMSAEDAAAFEQLYHEGKIGYIDRRILPRGLGGRQVAPMHTVIPLAPQLLDAINNAARFAYFFTKPGYVTTNLLGNAVLTLIHQGFAAPKNLLLAAKANAQLGPELTGRIDELMGEGIASAISPEHGVGSRLNQRLGQAIGRVQDTPFRRAAFLHEAQKAGFKTPEQIESLILDEHNRKVLSDVTERANQALVDYSDLTPFEREYVKRIIFVYPWVKGSTKYAGHFLREHPVQAGVYGTLAAQQAQRNQQELGPVPSYMEGAFRVGGSDQRPTVMNWGGISPFSTPIDAVGGLAALATGHPSKVSETAAFASPGAQFVSDVAHQRGFGHALAETYRGTPQYLLGQRIWEATHGGGAERLYPPDIRTALLQYGLGSWVPRTEQSDIQAAQYKREHPAHNKRKKKKTVAWGS